MRGRGRVLALLGAGALALLGCGTTVDSLGYDQGADPELHPLVGPTAYPNPFRELLNKSDADINAKITAAFNQLFHGDAINETIYFPSGADAAVIRDILHGDIRTEGIGLGMLVAVQLNKRDEFDRLWRYLRGTAQVKDGAAKGYFRSSCDIRLVTSSGVVDDTETCLDPFGLQQIVMTLVLAHDRWEVAGAPATVPYGAEALALFDVIRHKEDQNAGVLDGVTNTFDGASKLVYDRPDAASAAMMVSRPSIEMPAYYELWGQATGDPFWGAAAAAARSYWQRAANATTGLMPVRARFDGTSVPPWELYEREGFRTLLNLALDQLWSPHGPKDVWAVQESNRLLAFFSRQPPGSNAAAYTLDGSVAEPVIVRETALVVANGMIAIASTNADRTNYVQAVWDQTLTTGVPRYYSGLLHMVALLILGGQMRVY